MYDYNHLIQFIFNADMYLILLEGKFSKEFKSIQLRNNSLAVDFATDADEGYYMCQANNGIGSGLKKILHINVNGKHTYISIHRCTCISYLNFKFANVFVSIMQHSTFLP